MLMTIEFLPGDVFDREIGSIPTDIQSFNGGEGNCDV